jgi:UPF0755 protein
VVIPKGTSLATLSALLAEKDLINNAVVFRYYARQKGLGSALQAGSYELSPSMSAADIDRVLRSGSQSIWVTLPEGLRVEEIAERLAMSELSEFDQAEFIRIARPSEGRLFPDTYLVPRESTAEQLFTLLTTTFQKKVEKSMSTQLQKSERSLDDIIVIASLIQREGRTAKDMRIISGVIDNRLRKGMKLDIDATLSYLRGYDTLNQSWWSAPSVELKTVNSPYNTYLQVGLPPGPIANPGLAAIEAALDPVPTTALFYLHAPDGTAYFAETLAEHQANIERYLR